MSSSPEILASHEAVCVNRYSGEIYNSVVLKDTDDDCLDLDLDSNSTSLVNHGIVTGSLTINSLPSECHTDSTVCGSFKSEGFCWITREEVCLMLKEEAKIK